MAELPIITAFASSPDRGRGLARDMPVRWALEETGQAYAVHLVSFAEMTQPAHLALQPFGQIPTYQHDDLALFETGAIVLHIAEQRPGLLPSDPHARARAVAWLFAAKSTLEPVIVERESAVLTEREQPWFAARLPLLDAAVRRRLSQLSARLGGAEWFDGAFTLGDLMIATVLRRPSAAMFLPDFPNLAAYLARAEARDAFQRAFAAQHAVFAEGQPSLTSSSDGGQPD